MVRDWRPTHVTAPEESVRLTMEDRKNVPFPMLQDWDSPDCGKEGEIIAVKQYYGRRTDAVRPAMQCNERSQNINEEVEETCRRQRRSRKNN